MKNIYDPGNRRELMIDDFLTAESSGDISLLRHAPVQKETIPELKDLYYGTILKMGDVYRYYYRGIVEGYDGPGNDGNPGEYTGVLESTDAVHWSKPELNLYPQAAPDAIIFGTVETHNFTPFIDTNPECPPEERYKAIAGLCTGGGTNRFHSKDGIHWEKYDLPGLFSSYPGSHKTLDSQNICFWSESEKQYEAYFRYYLHQEGDTSEFGVRSIARSTSPDFIHWSEPEGLEFNMPGEHLYVSLFLPYFRAPHITIGTPTRFFDDRGGATDITLCHIRNGKVIRPFPEAWIVPGREKHRWENRCNYLTYNYLQTAEDELSFYHKAGIRFSLRLDGFCSLHSGFRGGRWISRPMRYRSGSLECNAATSAGGFFKAGIMDSDGKFLPGYSTEECDIFFGDEIAMHPSWNGKTELPLKDGDIFRLVFEIKECDIYSFCIQ